MSKIGLIIKREYLTRVKKKSFIIMTILGPVLIGGLYGVMFYMMLSSSDEITKIKFVDESGLFSDTLKRSGNLIFEKDTLPIQIAKHVYDPNVFAGILYVPQNIVEQPGSAVYYSAKQPGLATMENLETLLQKRVEDVKLNLMFSRMNVKDFDKNALKEIKTNIDIKTKLLTDKGEEESSTGVTSMIGFGGGLLMFIFTFLYGVQVMRGVIEEKTNRIVEVIISSVRPFQLMMGKIIGIALVGLTQFLLWIVLSAVITTVISGFAANKIDTKKLMHSSSMKQKMNLPQGNENFSLEAGKDQAGKSNPVGMIKTSLKSLPLPLIIFSFLFYFLGGYLFYASLFAAVGSAIDNETDTQQFMMPITIPLMLGYFAAIGMMSHPDSALGYWLSFVPFTSPIVMMVRIPFGVPAYELIISMALLVLGFIGTTWLASRIYRTGILMYGKKPSWKELGKWIFYKG
ncbi:MAG TPA: ABC transporter permease [Bacteroidia bacterium]|nr:ABC transporter permease [Bacteroidia bacterium]